MKIVKFEDFHVDCGWEIYSFLKISTDEGLTGWSEFREHRRPGIGAAIRGMSELLIGQDPRAISKIDAMLYSFTRTVPGGLNQNAAGAILNACLDIKGKALGVPCLRAVRRRGARAHAGLLVALRRDPRALRGILRRQGDRPRRRCAKSATSWRPRARRASAATRRSSAICSCSTRRAAASTRRAPRAGRVIPSSTCPSRCSTHCSPSSPRCGKAPGPSVRIAVDLNFNYKAEGFRRIAKKVEPFELMWLEMDIYEPAALAAIRQSTTTPIASLETILGRRTLRPYLDAHCVDVAIIDPQYNGVPEALRMAAMCDAYEVNVASHYFAGPLSAIICAHFAAVIPNLRISEYDVDEVPWKPKL